MGVLSNFFSYDGALFSTLNKITDLVWLNILWFICCLPIFTAGASTSALFYVTLHMARNEGSGVTKTFFQQFKRNFKQGTAIWLLALLVGGVLCTDLYIIVWMMDLPSLIHTSFVCVNFLLLLVFALTLLYVFPLQSMFENKIKHTIKNALILSIGHLPQSVVIGFMYFAIFFLAYLLPELVLPIITVIGFSGVSFAASFMFLRIFKKHMRAEDVEKPEKDPDQWEIPEDEVMSATDAVSDAWNGTDLISNKRSSQTAGSSQYTMSEADDVPEKGTEYL